MNWLSSIGHFIGHGLVSLVVLLAMSLSSIPSQNTGSLISTSTATDINSELNGLIGTNTSNLPNTISTGGGTSTRAADILLLEKLITYNKHPDPKNIRVNNLGVINPLQQISFLIGANGTNFLDQATRSIDPNNAGRSSNSQSVKAKPSQNPAAQASSSIQISPVQPAPIQPAFPPISLPRPALPLTEDVPAKAANSLVNIYCTSRQGNTLRIVTGSGVIIDPRGVALTDAHVAQNLLIAKDLQGVNMQCFARSGPLGTIKYNVELIYLSPEWVKENANNLKETAPQETGENDFALVKLDPLSGSGDIFNSPFRALSLADAHNGNSAAIGEKIIAGSYPAEILASESITTPLKSRTEYLSIQNISGFPDTAGQDIIQTTPSSLAQVGSSGGAITDINGNLISIISIIVPSASSNLDSIRGISMDHINSNLSRDLGFTLDTLSQQDIGQIESNFNGTEAPILKSLLVNGH